MRMLMIFALPLLLELMILAPFLPIAAKPFATLPGPEEPINHGLKDSLWTDISNNMTGFKKMNKLAEENSTDINKDDKSRWDPNDIPYFIDPTLDSYKNVIEYSLGEFEDTTCLRFRKLEVDDHPNWPQDYIVFNDSHHGCSSYIGRQGGPQLIALQAGACTFSGAVMHEIFHALGFLHEHNRQDRGKFLDINWSNVEKDMMRYLEKVDNETDSLTYGERYDYNSLLHGNNYLFAINTSVPTLSARRDPSLVLGQRHNLSSSDIIRLNAHYSCPVTTTTEATTPTSTATTTAPSTTTQNPCSTGKVPNYADPTDCTRFYVCSGVKATLMVCPSGLYYNEINYVCDWPSNVYCPWDNL